MENLNKHIIKSLTNATTLEINGLDWINLYESTVESIIDNINAAFRHFGRGNRTKTMYFSQWDYMNVRTYFRITFS